MLVGRSVRIPDPVKTPPAQAAAAPESRPLGWAQAAQEKSPAYTEIQRRSYVSYGQYYW